MGGEEEESMTKKKERHYFYIVRPTLLVQVPTLESIKNAMETYWVMENIGPRIHNQGKWQPASRPDRWKNRKKSPVPVDRTLVWPGRDNETNLGPY